MSLRKKESNPLEIQILNMIKKDNKISTEKMAMALETSSRTVKRHIKDIGIVDLLVVVPMDTEIIDD